MRAKRRQRSPAIVKPRGARIASLRERSVAAVIDGFVISFPGFGLIVGERLVLGSSLGVLIAVNVSFVLAAICYLVGCEATRGQTIGKYLVGIQVVDDRSHGPIGVTRAFVRTMYRTASFAAALLGYLWAIWDREHQTWHDKSARTLVLRVPKRPFASSGPRKDGAPHSGAGIRRCPHCGAANRTSAAPGQTIACGRCRSAFAA
jgi:uncharacterized RDD family membrane protein YckC